MLLSFPFQPRIHTSFVIPSLSRNLGMVPQAGHWDRAEIPRWRNKLFRFRRCAPSVNMTGARTQSPICPRRVGARPNSGHAIRVVRFCLQSIFMYIYLQV